VSRSTPHVAGRDRHQPKGTRVTCRSVGFRQLFTSLDGWYEQLVVDGPPRSTAARGTTWCRPVRLDDVTASSSGIPAPGRAAGGHATRARPV
jgi:hypothetical protein